MRAVTTDGLKATAGDYHYMSQVLLDPLSGTSKPNADTNNSCVDRISDRIMLMDNPTKSGTDGGLTPIVIEIFAPTKTRKHRVIATSISEDNLARPTSDETRATVKSAAAITGFRLLSTTLTRGHHPRLRLPVSHPASPPDPIARLAALKTAATSCVLRGSIERYSNRTICSLVVARVGET